ncbi:MAG: class I SAM-dependent methyltransferase [Casimicrobium sp.]
MWNSLFELTARGLPTLDAPSRMHGEALALTLAARIANSPTRCISFADFMRACLYEPALGYYTAGATKLGAAGDFTTAPEMSPLFGATLANAFSTIATHGVLELGAGSGALARSFLDAAPDGTYSILEVSADLRERQEQTLADDRVAWLDELPREISGLVLLNEVLDAVPCEIVRFGVSGYEQAFVAHETDAFAWRWLPLVQGELFDTAKLRVPPITGYTTEINLEAEALAATLASRLSITVPSAICFIDYGFPRREFYMPSRARGTLMCHFRHHAHDDPLVLPGLQDITSHIDFTAMAEACVEANDGTQVICYASQAKFLLVNGLLAQLDRSHFENDAQRIAATGAIQKIVSPTEMGELFKVLVVGNSQATEALSTLAETDECYRL